MSRYSEAFNVIDKRTVLKLLGKSISNTWLSNGNELNNLVQNVVNI